MTTTYTHTNKMPPSPAPPQAAIEYPSLPKTVAELDEAVAVRMAYFEDDFDDFDRPDRRRDELNRWAEDVRRDMSFNVTNAWNESMESVDRTFTPFSQLPTELRLRIWQYCLPTPRIVELGRSFNTRLNSNPIQPFQYRNKPVPPLLHTCSESRSEA